MVDRVIVGAHYGLKEWLIQRVTAVVMAVYTVLLAGLLIARSPIDFATWKALFTHGAMRVATLLFLLSVFYHAWVGVRDIVMDYVRPAGLRLVVEVLVIVALVGYAIWSVSILWSA
jgi:succinate dehydrogenase / fumarate reductase, membrane anchor subunit